MVGRLLLLTAICLVVFYCRTPSNQSSSALSDNEWQDDKRITIIGMTDFHGKIDGEQRDGRMYQGAEYVAQYIKAIKDSRPGNNPVFIVDAGDLFQGSMESNFLEGQPVLKWYNDVIGLHAAAFGNHEVDFGATNPPPLRRGDRMEFPIVSAPRPGTDDHPQGALRDVIVPGANFPFLGVNVFSDSNPNNRKRYCNTPEARPGDRPDWLKPSILYHVLEDGSIISAGSGGDNVKIKVGIIGATSVVTPDTTSRTLLKGLCVDAENTAKLITDEAIKLRRAGADYVILTMHEGGACDVLSQRGPTDLTDCEINKGHLFHLFCESNDTNGSGGTEDEYRACTNDRSHRGKFIPREVDIDGRRTKLIDVMVGGHTHARVVKYLWNAKVAVLQNQAKGKELSYVTLDQNTVADDLGDDRNQPRLAKQPVEVVGIPIRENDSRYRDCAHMPKIPNNWRAEEVWFKDRRMNPDLETCRIFEEIRSQTKKIKEQPVLRSGPPGASEEERGVELRGALTYAFAAQNPSGNMVAEMMRRSLGADLGLQNNGGLRVTLGRDDRPTKLLFGDIFTLLPFDNMLAEIKVTGAQLKEMIAIGLDDRLDGITETFSWAGDNLEIKCRGGIKVFLGGEEVRDDDIKTIATSDYLADGGSGLAELRLRVGDREVQGLQQVNQGDERAFVPGTFRLRTDKPLMRRAVFEEIGNLGRDSISASFYGRKNMTDGCPG